MKNVYRQYKEEKNESLFNFPVQATGSEILKLILKEAIKLGNSYGTIVLTVHDEIVIECNESEEKKIAQKYQEILDNISKTLMEDMPFLFEVNYIEKWE